MDEIRLGTIGSGFIVNNILEAVSRTDGILLEAVFSRSKEKGRELAERFGAARAYTSLEDLLADPQVNTVYVASPNSLHFEHCKAALEHGKHVICEKPMCVHEKEVCELLALAKSRRLFLVDGTPTPFLPNFAILKEQVKKVGRVRLVLCNYSQYSSRYDKLKKYINQKDFGSQEGEHKEQTEKPDLPNVFNPEFAGGSLMDINYYNVYFMVSLFGIPLKAMYFPNRCRSGVDTSGIIVLQYPDFTGQGSGAKDTWGVNSAQIEGEQGYLYVEQGSNGIAKVQLVTKHGEENWNEQTADIPGESNRWYYEIRDMVKMIREEDLERCYRQTQTAADVMGVIETARKEAGIIFPGD